MTRKTRFRRKSGLFFGFGRGSFPRKGINARQLVVGEGGVFQRPQVVFDLRRGAGPDDYRRNAFIAQKPCQRHFGQRLAALPGDVVQGAEPFLEIKDCRLIDGKNGAFVSYPARKDDKGKYWPYLYGGETFNAHVVKLAQAGLPQTARPKPKGGSGFDDMADDPPF